AEPVQEVGVTDRVPGPGDRNGNAGGDLLRDRTEYPRLVLGGPKGQPVIRAVENQGLPAEVVVVVLERVRVLRVNRSLDQPRRGVRRVALKVRVPENAAAAGPGRTAGRRRRPVRFGLVTLHGPGGHRIEVRAAVVLGRVAAVVGRG